MAKKRSALVEEQERPLTETEEKMVEARLMGETLSGAMRAAGYAVTTNTAKARTDRIQKAMNEARAEISKASTLTRLDVLEGFLECINDAKKLSEPSTMIAGWDKVAKMMGYYEPQTIKHEVTVNGAVMVKKMEMMSDDELMNLIEGECKQVN